MMRNLVAAALLAAPGLLAPAAAQVPPAELGQRNVPAPWWMREPVIASIGSVRSETPANRARFEASFREVERDAPDATAKANARIAALDAELRALGANRVRLTTGFTTQPLFEQYRDRQGQVQENQRGDKVDRYEVTATLSIEVLDIALLERAYGRVIDARPTSVSEVQFGLEPTNADQEWIYTEAVRDAARRARSAAAAAGARLGAVKVIDPSGGVCRTQVLAGWPSYTSGPTATDVGPPPPPPPPAPAMMADNVIVTGSRRQAAPTRVTLQPPRRLLESTACVIYGLLP